MSEIDEVVERLRTPVVVVAEPEPDAELPNAPWPDPIPLATAETLPDWPAEFFEAAPWVRDMIEASARAAQCPLAYVGMAALGALSVSLMGKVQVAAETFRSTPINLFLLFGAPPSSGKSEAIRLLVTSPVGAWHKRQVEEHAEAIAKRRARIVVLKRQLRALGRQVDQHLEDEQKTARLQTRMVEVEQELEELAAPTVPRLLLDDATSEVLARRLRDEGPMTIASAESTFLSVISGSRYGGAPSFDLLNKAWSGERYIYDRKGDGGQSIRIDEPLVSLVLATQPEKIRMLGARGATIRDGLFARLLSALPRDMRGSRKPSGPWIPKEIRERYKAGLESLLDVARGPNRHTIEATDEARTAFDRLHYWAEPRLTGSLSVVEDWAGRARQHAVRLAGLLHVAANTEDDGWRYRPLEVETAEAAVGLVREYFTPHAIAVARLMSEPKKMAEAQGLASVLLEWLPSFIERSAGEEVRLTRRIVMQGPRAFRGRPDLAQDALDELEEHAYLRGYARSWSPSLKKHTPKHYACHPELWPQV